MRSRQFYTGRIAFSRAQALVGSATPDECMLLVEVVTGHTLQEWTLG